MKKTYDLAGLDWRLAGFTPFQWGFEPCLDITKSTNADVPAIPAKVPGSVQRALRDAGVLPDWNVGLNARLCEWVEHRHWIYQAAIPDAWLEKGKKFRLHCLGLDYCGIIRLNGKEVSRFENGFVPYEFDLTPHLGESGNVIQIIFECHPAWLGQFGYTSKMTEWKPRFYYTWDWTPRLVQTGVWDAITLEVTDGEEFSHIACTTDADPASGTGILDISGFAHGSHVAVVHIKLSLADEIIQSQSVGPEAFAQGLSWRDLPVELWWPHTQGAQPLYDVTCRLLDDEGNPLDQESFKVGFRHIGWEPCEGAPEGADPWLCVVNGQRVFLQGVNWVPVLPNFADVPDAYVRQRLELYKSLGVNILRVWGGAVLGNEAFYTLCDELGLLVWQEFPLSSSGLDNWPPDSEHAIRDLAEIAESYIERRQHHVSLALWCGGNELTQFAEGRKTGMSNPIDATHPLIAQLKQVVEDLDPKRRFLPTSSSGPRFCAAEADFGKGLHWDVHGPWKVPGDIETEWPRYWAGDDSLFRSETGSPGASSAELIRQYAGGLDPMPASAANPLWRRFGWWIEWDRFVADHGREPQNLEEYVAWSQARQAKALSIAVGAVKARFPKVGGIILWMGHDCFPCTANTSIVDFHGQPKPAALAVGEIFRR